VIEIQSIILSLLLHQAPHPRLQLAHPLLRSTHQHPHSSAGKPMDEQGKDGGGPTGQQGKKVLDAIHSLKLGVHA
jgi:hypothetical protein